MSLFCAHCLSISQIMYPRSVEMALCMWVCICEIITATATILLDTPIKGDRGRTRQTQKMKSNKQMESCMNVCVNVCIFDMRACMPVPLKLMPFLRKS